MDFKPVSLSHKKGSKQRLVTIVLLLGVFFSIGGGIFAVIRIVPPAKTDKSPEATLKILGEKTSALENLKEPKEVSKTSSFSPSPQAKNTKASVAKATVKPTATSSPSPSTVSPGPSPTQTLTPEPTATPTPTPTATAEPIQTPTPSPSPSPTESPTPSPSS